jgi:predicted ABC-type ATPase
VSQPILTIIAGSNGCGKSTITASSREKFQDNPVLDPDAMAKAVASSGAIPSSIDAGKLVLRRAEELLQTRESFTVETTLSGYTYLRMAERAKSAGYLIAAILIGTSSVEVNIQRIKNRVSLGGHDIPEDDQRRRFPRTLANMKRLLPIADFLLIFDNSNTENPHELIAYGTKGSIHWNEPVPAWAASLRDP